MTDCRRHWAGLQFHSSPCAHLPTKAGRAHRAGEHSSAGRKQQQALLPPIPSSLMAAGSFLQMSKGAEAMASNNLSITCCGLGKNHPETIIRK